jgi:hypothetical protein
VTISRTVQNTFHILVVCEVFAMRVVIYRNAVFVYDGYEVYLEIKSFYVCITQLSRLNLRYNSKKLCQRVSRIQQLSPN